MYKCTLKYKYLFDFFAEIAIRKYKVCTPLINNKRSTSERGMFDWNSWRDETRD